ncbi:hypothetical protein [Rhizohabitans arisaemae]|uniref:hypothetical protein n=1 Tax=Rhizohabitans arisaemae TaxID=2720610 RepID=UPI0024B1D889|nr:hypothetical protein [Rhizohabitans arisaemae]
MREVPLSELDYGSCRYSRDAWEKRTSEEITKQRNVATFHLVRRPSLTGQVPAGDPLSFTTASTGSGIYITVGHYVEHQVRINASHSESVFIHDGTGGLQKLIDRQVFPQQYVVDWVYTERPACPDVYWSMRRVAKGCKTELQEVENLQRLRKWDVGEKGFEPYGQRDDLQITVYSSFTGAKEIGQAAVFAPVRRSVVNDLTNRLTELYQEDYAERGRGTEEYDLDEYERRIPEDSRDIAESELPSWTDYELRLSQVRLFREALEEEADKIYNNKKDALNTTEDNNGDADMVDDDST